MFLGFLPEGERSVGENVARYFELWRTAEGGGLSEFGAARRLIDHLPPRWDEWAHALMSDMTEEDFYTKRRIDFTLFISCILTHWLQNQNGPVFPPLPPPPPPAPSPIPFHHPTALAQPPVPTSFHFPTAPVPPPLSSFEFPTPPAYPSPPVPPPPSSPPPFEAIPLHSPWDSAPMETEPFIQPLYEHHPWGPDPMPIGHCYYIFAPVPLPVYPSPPAASSPPLPTAPPNSPHSPLEIKKEPEDSSSGSSFVDLELGLTEYALH